MATRSVVAQVSATHGTNTTIIIDTPMPPPPRVLAERALLKANADGVELFIHKYVNAGGYLRGPEHWGITDGPDDAVESIPNWSLAHALGGPDSLIEAWHQVWEGHIDQYTRTRVPEVDVAAEGIYYREFTPSFDWEHIGEGLAGFYFYGLSRPHDPQYITRLERFAGFYLPDETDLGNYDSKHHIIRSLWSRSHGPKLTSASPTDWDGPPVPGGAPGRRTRFLKASNLKGDHPLNLGATNLALHAYMVTAKSKYRDWLLDYVDAWRTRTKDNGGNIPSNIGLDGTIGGKWGGKWYSGIFGWNSSDEGTRNYVLRGPPEGFGNALLLTGNQAYADVLRQQVNNLYVAKRVENGKTLIPVYYGKSGWYGYHDVDVIAPVCPIDGR
ncbi:MAG: hypothetical protein KTR25_08110 [Myxococcales bacterium]|nr:hypothetical protein [Myxococcales bacterium]